MTSILFRHHELEADVLGVEDCPEKKDVGHEGELAKG